VVREAKERKAGAAQQKERRRSASRTCFPRRDVGSDPNADAEAVHGLVLISREDEARRHWRIAIVPS
jgi:hypothetical protein